MHVPYSLQVLSGVVGRLSRYGVIYHSNTDRMSKYQLLHARDQFRMNHCPPTGVMVSCSSRYNKINATCTIYNVDIRVHTSLYIMYTV